MLPVDRNYHSLILTVNIFFKFGKIEAENCRGTPACLPNERSEYRLKLNSMLKIFKPMVRARALIGQAQDLPLHFF
jgi:hypothetical protein